MSESENFSLYHIISMRSHYFDKLISSDHSPEKGFTLVEIIAVLVILGILAAFAVTRYTDLEENAKQKAFNTLLTEINAREFLTWSSLSNWCSFRFAGNGQNTMPIGRPASRVDVAIEVARWNRSGWG